MANAIPFVILAIGYGLLYLVGNPKEMNVIEQLCYIVIIGVSSAVTLGMRHKVIGFLVRFVERRK